MALGLATSLSTVRKTKLVRAVTSGLVLKSNFDTGEVVPISDGSASFDGTNDYINVANNSDLDMGTDNDFSISFWVKINGAVSDSRFLVDRNHVTSYSVYVVSGGALKIALHGEYLNIASNDIDDDKWHHVVASYDRSANLNAYLDGRLVGTKDISSITDDLDNSSALGIGRSTSSGGYLNGYMCNVGLWSSALTLAEVKSIMYKNYADLQASEKTNLISWWNLDEVADSNNLHVADLVSARVGATVLTNGDFSSGDFTGWTAAGAVSISTAEVVSHDGHRTAAHIVASTSDKGYNQSVLTVGRVYKVSFDIKVIAGGIYLGKDNNKVGGVNYTDSSWTSYTHYWTAGDTYMRFYSSSAGVTNEYYIDNVSVKPTNYGTLS